MPIIIEITKIHGVNQNTHIEFAFNSKQKTNTLLLRIFSHS